MSKLPTFLSWSSQIKIYPQPPANVTRAVIKTEELCSVGSEEGMMNSARGSWGGSPQEVLPRRVLREE